MDVGSGTVGIWPSPRRSRPAPALVGPQLLSGRVPRLAWRGVSSLASIWAQLFAGSPPTPSPPLMLCL